VKPLVVVDEVRPGWDPVAPTREVDGWQPTIDAVQRAPIELNLKLGSYVTFCNLVGMCSVALPEPMALGPVTLSDGSVVVGFTCAPAAIAGAGEISEFGGWRSYIASR